MFREGTMTYAVRTDIKAEVIRRGRRLRDLGRDVGMDYDRFSRVLNGYVPAPERFDARVREVLAQWDRDDGRTTATAPSQGTAEGGRS